MTQKVENINLDIEEMAKAGLHFGHATSKFHPKMTPYVFGVRNGIHIIDLEKTKEKLKEALKFIQQLVAENKILLVVGTKFQIKDLVKDFAKEFGFPYVTERWLGGTFTNFPVIKQRCEYLKELEQKLQNQELMEKYTKKERKEMEKKLQKLETKFGGIKNLERLPDAVFIIDMKKDELAVKEARRKGVKIIAISDTDSDPTLADYPIPANNDAISSVKYILEKVREAILIQKSKVKT
jgi:small subunit ribosomal protein S2